MLFFQRWGWQAILVPLLPAGFLPGNVVLIHANTLVHPLADLKHAKINYSHVIVS